MTSKKLILNKETSSFLPVDGLRNKRELIIESFAGNFFWKILKYKLIFSPIIYFLRKFDIIRRLIKKSCFGIFALKLGLLMYFKKLSDYFLIGNTVSVEVGRVFLIKESAVGC